MTLFAGFTRRLVDVGEVTIASVEGGAGPAVLLLHGYPQNMYEWEPVAALLARHATVVCGDLRGYGDSSKPAGTADYANYSFRAMAADQVALMRKLGHERFVVVGHDRGARVAHRLALDWPQHVAGLVTCDIVPTFDMYTEVDQRLALTYWQWYFMPQPFPFPERMIGANPDYWFEYCLVSTGTAGLERFNPALLEQYRRCWRDPAMIHASCCDYRAGATLDIAHDRADRDRKLQMPMLATWGAQGIMHTLWDIPAKWRDRAAALQTAAIPGGHFFPEHSPAETAAAIAAFMQGL